MLVYEEKVKTNREAFVVKVRAISTQMGIDPNWLMAVMNFESGMNHQAVNPKSNATGLIQFMPSTARGIGTSVEALKAMTNVEQLDWVLRYFRPYVGKMTSYIDVYLTVFFPAAVGKSDDWVLQTSSLSASKIAEQNHIFDVNNDGKITVGEIKSVMLNRLYPPNWRDIISEKKKN